MRFLTNLIFSIFAASALHSGDLGPISWPTPNPAFMEGKELEAFIQPTVSGRTISGLYGCTRNDGYRFHEGIDLFPIFRNRSGEADDPIFAVMRGRVVSVNPVAGNSGYGRFVVLEHPEADVNVYTLYAHLATIQSGIEPGVWVNAGDILGKMGRSATYAIPKERAHLHFEIGVRISDGFQRWFEEQQYSEPNRFGIWNGINLSGVDPLAFFIAVREGRFANFREFLWDLAVLTRVRVHTATVPDFVRRHPQLLERPLDREKALAGWDIDFTEYGVPIRWRPYYAGDLPARPAGTLELITVNEELRESTLCWKSLRKSGATYAVDAHLARTLSLLFEY